MADEIEDAGTSDAFDRQDFNPKFKWVEELTALRRVGVV